jgi:hypothetical protein
MSSNFTLVENTPGKGALLQATSSIPIGSSHWRGTGGQLQSILTHELNWLFFLVFFFLFCSGCNANSALVVQVNPCLAVHCLIYTSFHRLKPIRGVIIASQRETSFFDAPGAKFASIVTLNAKFALPYTLEMIKQMLISILITEKGVGGLA